MNKITLIIAGFLIISCGSFNEANGQGELHLNKNISTGQGKLNNIDIVRHPIVSKIVKAYEKEN